VNILLPVVAATFDLLAIMTSQPNTTLYLNNLNDKVNKDELRSQLFALFTTYGKIIDIVALKSKKMRGQAFLVFTDLAGATSAMRACEGMVFYDKPLVCARLIKYRERHLNCHIAY
jgi:U2 small nuclear ribonucleoprotein B''